MANEVLYGFHRLEHVFDKRVNEVGVDVVSSAIDAAVEAYNRETNLMLGIFATPRTDFKVVYRVPGFNRSQPLDEDGRARKIRQGAQYETAFPLLSSGNAWGANYVSRVKMTVAEAQEATQVLTAADAIWLRDQMLAALFTNANYTFDDDEHGALTIKPLANNDSTQYIVTGQSSPLATDSHFMAQLNAISDSDNPFPTIYTELKEHPTNTGEVIHFVATNLVSDIAGLQLYYPVLDGNVDYAERDRMARETLGFAHPGTLKGYVENGGYIVEWPQLPSGYMISVTEGGPRPLVMRQHEESELQGYRLVARREDHPFWEAQYARWAGFGVWNRVGAVVTQIGSGSYSIPTGLQAPIA